MVARRGRGSYIRVEEFTHLLQKMIAADRGADIAACRNDTMICIATYIIIIIKCNKINSPICDAVLGGGGGG